MIYLDCGECTKYHKVFRYTRYGVIYSCLTYCSRTSRAYYTIYILHYTYMIQLYYILCCTIYIVQCILYTHNTNVMYTAHTMFIKAYQHNSKHATFQYYTNSVSYPHIHANEPFIVPDNYR